MNLIIDNQTAYTTRIHNIHCTQNIGNPDCYGTNCRLIGNTQFGVDIKNCRCTNAVDPCGIACASQIQIQSLAGQCIIHNKLIA